MKKYIFLDFWLGPQITYQQPQVTLLNDMIFFVKQGEKSYIYSNKIPYFYAQNQLKSATLKVINFKFELIF